ALLQNEADTNTLVLHPPDRTQTFRDPDALYAAYRSRALVQLPANAAKLGLRYGSGIGRFSHDVGATSAVYRGLRAPALDLLAEQRTETTIDITVASDASKVIVDGP